MFSVEVEGWETFHPQGNVPTTPLERPGPAKTLAPPASLTNHSRPALRLVFEDSMVSASSDATGLATRARNVLFPSLQRIHPPWWDAV